MKKGNTTASTNKIKESKVINIAPYEYIWVKDINLSTINVVCGPKNYILQEHEELVGEVPMKMIILPPMHYICVRNPVVIENGLPVKDKDGQIRVSHAEIQYRFHDDYKQPFFFYYGEEAVGGIERLKYVNKGEALKLRALRSFKETLGEITFTRTAGEEWLFRGPKLYYPRGEVEISTNVKSIVIGPCQALRLKAKQNFTDSTNINRKAGEEWLIRKTGSYIPDVYETVIKLESPITISLTQAIQLRAVKSFTDHYGKEHRAGEEWLITPNISTWHVIDIYEDLVAIQNLTILSRDKYAVILNPVDENGKNIRGGKKLVKGEKSFFLQPGEELEKGIQNVIILNENEAVLLQCKERFRDEDSEEAMKIERVPGDKWMIRGPCRFVPAIEVEVVERRSVIPLDENEGIYVRDTKTGTVRSVIGKSYLLQSNEELWAKELTQIEEEILAGGSTTPRDKTRVVSYKCPYNTILQIYNFKTEKSRIVFGPDLVMLEPDEQFCLMSLSGKTPKIPGVVKTLYLNMGPTYTTDRIEVETSDHALLLIEVAYNWHFDVKRSDSHDTQRKIFSVRDCIGEMCSIMASRVRGAVAEMTLNAFHKNSARVIRSAVMGENSQKKINDKYLFENNLLAISNVDIKNISTKDEATKEKLQVTVNLAIELTTKSQEEEAKRQAESRDQEAKSMLQRKIIEDNSLAEDLKRPLFDLKSQTRSIEESGLKEAEAKSKVNKMMIESQSKIKIATTNKELQNLKNKFKIEMESLEHAIKMDYEINKNKLELQKKEKLSTIETNKFKNIIDTIGQDTLVQISEAGPESQVTLLKSLGLEGFIMTDGNNPINLFNLANQLAKSD
jgi:major vault protein